MEKKQTAVEWLKDILGDYGCNIRVDIDWKTLDGLIEQAKEMEKEQIIDAANIPIKDRGYDATKFSNCGQQHYSRTYGK